VFEGRQTGHREARRRTCLAPRRPPRQE
jgi:hypothetical protein